MASRRTRFQKVRQRGIFHYKGEAKSRDHRQIRKTGIATDDGQRGGESDGNGGL
ncbi:hypothetical protein B4135_0807 [Caldibacillus debilis]|uniref:Uncharacterized protein n=1 Tax=Caldibacillus debilis TaxID=301148 RepID=A0A150M5U7_9BACI|nr:hypothetical protein B4135_0807 [Caldibacillus debilis]